MNLIKTYFLLLLGSLAALPSARAVGDLTIHSGGTIIIHTNIQVDAGRFVVESGGLVNIDLGAKVTATNIVYGGTLTVPSNNLALSNGQSYTLFSAPSYTGTFLTMNLPTLASSLTWSNRLASSGSL